MSILIKDMEMPKDGNWRSIRIYPDGTIGRPIGFGDYALVEGAKAVPVPAHGRLGDLDKLEQMFSDIDRAPYSSFDGSEPFYSAEDAAQIIRLAPTIIPAEEETT